MSDPSQETPDRPEDRTRFQFGLGHLFGLTFLVAVFLGTTVGLYPFSLMMLPQVLVVGLAGLLFLLIRRKVFEKKGPTLTGLLVVLTIMYPLLSFLASGYVDQRGAARRWQCCNNLKGIALALHNYHDRYRCFPPAFIADDQGRPMHSWRVLILPFVEEVDLYARYDFNEPWDGPNNRFLGAEMPRVFQCPEDTASPTATSYVVVVGPETMWPDSETMTFRDIGDGTSNTLMVVEMANSGIHWMEPRDLEFAKLPMSVNPKTGRGICSLHRPESWVPKRPYGANAAMADGSVSHMLPTDVSSAKLRAILTANGNEPVDWDALSE